MADFSNDPTQVAPVVPPTLPEAVVERKRPFYGNPIWGSDALEVSEERRHGRREGIQEAIKLILGPSLMTNVHLFQKGIDSTVDLLMDRLKEL